MITLTLDLGQKEDFKEIAAEVQGHRRWQSTTRLDVKEEFISDYILPSIRANGMYEGKYPLATALGRPLIATKLVEVAEKEGATAVSHGCTGKGNDQVRIDVTVRALNPSLKVIAPVREWNMSRDQELIYAKKHNIMLKPSNSIFSIDQNLWGRAIESGPLEDANTEPPASAFEWVTQPRDAPDTPGIPGDRLRGWHTEFAERGPEGRPGAHPTGETSSQGSTGSGSSIISRTGWSGSKSREVYEAPAAVSIIEAHRDLGAARPDEARARVQGRRREGVVLARLLGAVDGSPSLRALTAS